MAQIKKANGLVDWLDQRLAVRSLTRVLMTEYWIPKNINFLWAGRCTFCTFYTPSCLWNLSFDVL